MIARAAATTGVSATDDSGERIRDITKVGDSVRVIIRENRTAFSALTFIASLGLMLGVTAAQAAPEPLRKVTSVEGITEYRLDNGLRVLLFPDPTRPKVTVNLTVLVGSRHEGYGETGMAHLLEHMVFKGTPTHPDIPGAMKERGAQFNGSTWRRSDQLLRDLAGHRPEPRVRHPARGRPHGQQPDQGRGPGDRVLGGPQRVRDRAKTRPSACCRSG